MIGPIVLRNDTRLDLLIMDLSVGGMRGIVAKEEANQLREEEIVRLEGIGGVVNFHPGRSIEMRVKWIMNMNLFDHVGMGCEFIDLPETIAREIERFVDAERASRGQDA